MSKNHARFTTFQSTKPHLVLENVVQCLPLRLTVFVVDGIVLVDERFLLRVLSRRVKYCNAHQRSQM